MTLITTFLDRTRLISKVGARGLEGSRRGFKSEAGFGCGVGDAKVREGKQCSVWNWQQR